MTTILLICSVALNIVLLVWALVIWGVKKQREELAMDWKKTAMDEWEELPKRRLLPSVTQTGSSTPGTSTESPTPANDAD